VSATVEIPDAERATREAIGAAQHERLVRLVAAVHGGNRFYTAKLDRAGVTSDDVRRLGVRALPQTTKAELIADQSASPPWGTKLTEPIEHYTRYSQTSSTTGQPLRWPDTTESWQSLLECWKAVYRGARVTAADRIFFPFSFGPFLGFWTAFDAGCQIGAHCVPGGGMSSQVRLAIIESIGATVVCCTPTYALRLAEVAAADAAAARALREGPVRVVIVAGEPGGSIASTRRRIETAWGARVIDHYGLTEAGPIAFECWEGAGALHLNEREFLCEVIDASTGQPVADGEMGELVVTTLGRVASPVLRYRTGDIVRFTAAPCACGRTFARIPGGVLARTDDMINVRGVNVYPAAIEAVVRQFHEIDEFRSTVSTLGTMRALSIELELNPAAHEQSADVETRLAQRLREALGLTVALRIVASGTLPRYEMKARRMVIEPW
jgi:phenylacetate-CoA ligase